MVKWDETIEKKTRIVPNQVFVSKLTLKVTKIGLIKEINIHLYLLDRV